MDADPRHVGALVNLGALDYEYALFEDAALKFLDALEIKRNDEEALCNLALALKKTGHLDYAKIAFEEAVNVSPGNTFILSNYMMYLLEQKQFDQFNRVMTHAKRVMDKSEMDTITRLHEEFKAAMEGREIKFVPNEPDYINMPQN